MQRNLTLSALKGFAILAIIVIHLLDWSNFVAGQTYPAWIREVLHVFVLFFVALSGTVIYIAYAQRDFSKAASRLMLRGLQIIGIYYLYVLIKFGLMELGWYPIAAEPYFMMFQNAGIWTWKDMLLMHSGSVPLGILVTIGFLVFISPIFLWIAQKCTYAKTIILAITAIVFYFSFLHQLDIDIFYAQGYSFFAPLPWLTIFLLGFFLAMIGFEQQKEWLLVLFSSLIAGSMYYLSTLGKALYPTWYMYPLHWYYIVVGFFAMVLCMYLISLLIKKQESKIVAAIFNFLETAGNETMYLYIAHWVVIDLTLLATHFYFADYLHSFLIWYSVGALMLWYVWSRRNKIWKTEQ